MSKNKKSVQPVSQKNKYIKKYKLKRKKLKLINKKFLIVIDV